MNEGFQSSLDHLLAELKRIELKLRLQIMSLRQGNDQTGDGKFRGLYISEREIDVITGALPFQSLPQSDNSATVSLAESL